MEVNLVRRAKKEMTDQEELQEQQEYPGYQ
jgi:hypothetical protein